MISRLNKNSLKVAAEELGKKIPQFKKILKQFGVPPLWDRPSGFSTLIYIILEQQVSLKSAKATFDKLSEKLGSVDPNNFLTLNNKQLKSVGFSKQKTEYCRIVAKEILGDQLNLHSLTKMSDKEIKVKLMFIKGIGHWTSDIYLLMVLLRPDVWPHGDRALAVAVYEVFSLTEIPDYDSLQIMADSWKPYRSVAARLLWHHYLSTTRKK